MGFFNEYMDSDGSEFGFHDVPDHIDPLTGHYKTGVRKCSNCKKFKMKVDFTAEEAKKAAARRLCNACMASGVVVKKKAPKKSPAAAVPKAPTASEPSFRSDIKSMPTKEMKRELESHGISTTALKKGDLIDALVNARKERQETCGTTLTLEHIVSFKVADLKRELKDRSCPVSGLKAVLQSRLADAVGVSIDSSGAEASAKKNPEAKTPAKTMSEGEAPTKKANHEKNKKKANAVAPTKTTADANVASKKMTEETQRDPTKKKKPEPTTQTTVEAVVSTEKKPADKHQHSNEESHRKTIPNAAKSFAPNFNGRDANDTSTADKENDAPKMNPSLDGNAYLYYSYNHYEHNFDAKEPRKWRTVPPPQNTPQVARNTQGCTFYWCGKCGYWTTSHLTVGHVDGKKHKIHVVKPIGKRGLSNHRCNELHSGNAGNYYRSNQCAWK